METLGKESPSTVKKWVAEFRRGRESIEDDEQSGYPKETASDENFEIVRRLVMCDRRPNLRDKFWGSSVNPNRHRRNVPDLG